MLRCMAGFNASRALTGTYRSPPILIQNSISWSIPSLVERCTVYKSLKQMLRLRGPGYLGTRYLL